MPAVLHFLQGEANLTLGDDTVEARPGTWVHMPKGLRDGIQAKTPVVIPLLPAFSVSPPLKRMANRASSVPTRLAVAWGRFPRRP
jgi:hypothetical protein